MRRDSAVSVMEIPDILRRPAPSLSVEVITNYQAFIEFEPTWNRLVEEAGIEFPFVRHEWIRALWDCFDHGGTLHIIVVREDDCPIAIAPLMLDRVRMYGIPVRRMRGIANIYTERFDFILSARPSECCAVIWTYLADHNREWDVLELRQLTEESRAMACMPREDIDRRLLMTEWIASDSPYVPVRDLWEAYFKSLKKSHRANIRKSQHHLEASAPLKLEVVVSNVHLDADIEEALNLEAVAWKDEGGTAIRSRPDSMAFYRQILHTAGKQGWLRIYFLTLGSKRIAVRIALLFRNKVYMLKSGYDPEYAASSPGHVLCHKILDEAWRLKFDEVDFLGNTERWKLNWARDLRRHFWLFAFPKRVKPRLLHYMKVSLIPRLRESRLNAPLRRVASSMDVAPPRD
jgi:CelD/BcsL family acetyltransferase involved in cellulose biosynthesis